MTVREYFGSFFTRAYWRALGDLFVGTASMSHRARADFWEKVDREAEEAANDRG